MQRRQVEMVSPFAKVLWTKPETGAMGLLDFFSFPLFSVIPSLAKAAVRVDCGK
jgi:hypothetical protein